MVNEETQNSPQNEKKKEMRKGEGGRGRGRYPFWKLMCHIL